MEEKGTDENKIERKVIKITNPEWLGVIGPFINSFLEKVPIPGVRYESLFTYFQQGIAQGQAAAINGLRDTIEFWVVFEDKKPVAFAHWFVQGLPSIGSVYCDVAYSWQTKKIPIAMLAKEFVKFGKQHRCPLYKFDAANERVFKAIGAQLEKVGLKINRTERISSWAVQRADQA